MTATEFPEVNLRIGEGQEEYQTLPVHLDKKNEQSPVTMCFELDAEELKQVKETGKIWITVVTFNKPFSPIGMSCLKPENFK